MMIVGSVISVSTRPPTMRRRLRQMRKLDEHRKAKDTEHDGWHGREIGNVYLDQVGKPVFRRRTPPDRSRRPRQWAGQAINTTSIMKNDPMTSKPRSPPLPGGLSDGIVSVPVMKFNIERICASEPFVNCIKIHDIEVRGDHEVPCRPAMRLTGYPRSFDVAASTRDAVSRPAIRTSQFAPRASGLASVPHVRI